jgi:hypothetical protein
MRPGGQETVIGERTGVIGERTREEKVKLCT